MDASTQFLFQAGAHIYSFAGMECRPGISQCGFCEMHWNIVLTLDVDTCLINCSFGSTQMGSHCSHCGPTHEACFDVFLPYFSCPRSMRSG